MVFHGGALGAVCGFAALRRNTEIFRGEGGIPKKFVITGLISVVAVFIYYVLAIVAVTFIRGGHHSVIR
jgi:hypothetical protein